MGRVFAIDSGCQIEFVLQPFGRIKVDGWTASGPTIQGKMNATIGVRDTIGPSRIVCVSELERQGIGGLAIAAQNAIFAILKTVDMTLKET